MRSWTARVSFSKRSFFHLSLSSSLREWKASPGLPSSIWMLIRWADTITYVLVHVLSCLGSDSHDTPTPLIHWSIRPSRVAYQIQLKHLKTILPMERWVYCSLGIHRTITGLYVVRIFFLCDFFHTFIYFVWSFLGYDSETVPRKVAVPGFI